MTEPVIDPADEPRIRNGALCTKLETGGWIWANPGDPMFSSVTMVATHYRKAGKWVDIYAEEPDNDCTNH